MEEAGQKLKRIRERLGLTYRDVEEASARIAEANQNDEFVVALSRLSDIETKGVVPNIFRLYSFAVIYRRDVRDLMAVVTTYNLSRNHRTVLLLADGEHSILDLARLSSKSVDEITVLLADLESRGLVYYYATE